MIDWVSEKFDLLGNLELYKQIAIAIIVAVTLVALVNILVGGAIVVWKKMRKATGNAPTGNLPPSGITPPSPAPATGTNTIVKKRWYHVSGGVFFILLLLVVIGGALTLNTQVSNFVWGPGVAFGRDNALFLIGIAGIVGALLLLYRQKSYKWLGIIVGTLGILFLIFPISAWRSFGERINSYVMSVIESDSFHIPSPTAEVDEDMLNFHSVVIDDTPIQEYLRRHQCIYNSAHSKVVELRQGRDARGLYKLFGLRPGVTGPVAVNFWLREKVGGICPPS